MPHPPRPRHHLRRLPRRRGLAGGVVSEFEVGRDMTADEHVARFVLAKYRDDFVSVSAADDKKHLAKCLDTTVRHVVGSDGFYGCESMCEYATLTAAVSCPHGFSDEYEYGEFGDLGDLLRDVERYERA